MYTVGQLVKEFGLSRSTLLFYDKIGLLKPSARSEANYRLYSQADFGRMAQISTYRKAGLSLDSIAEVLCSEGTKSSSVLKQRLENLNSEISRLRNQQQLIISLLGNDSFLRSTKVMNKSQWVAILKSSGMDEEAMRRWHIEFEKDLPKAHSDFLESLGIDKTEIEEIKSWAIL